MEQGVQLFSLPPSPQGSPHCLTHSRLLTNICWKQWINVFPKEKNLFGIPEAKEPSIFVLLLFRNIPFQLATYTVSRASQVVLVVKNLPPNARDIRDAVLIPGSGRSPGGGHGNPLQHSCLENPMDRGAQRAIQSMELQRESDTTERLNNNNSNKSYDIITFVMVSIWWMRTPGHTGLSNLPRTQSCWW